MNSRILIVEDNRDQAESLRLLLELRGYEVRVAHNWLQGVKLANEWRPEVVLCDIGLPRLDGYGVAAALRGNPATAEAFLVAVTAYSSDEDRMRAWRAGFSVHVAKPADPNELLGLLPRGQT